MKYYWLIVILLFGVKLIKEKELSSYSIKWMLVYIMYLLWLHVDTFAYVDWDTDMELYVAAVFIFPLVLYLLFPFIWKFLGRWKLFRWIEDMIDIWYSKIKDLS